MTTYSIQYILKLVFSKTASRIISWSKLLYIECDRQKSITGIFLNQSRKTNIIHIFIYFFIKYAAKCVSFDNGHAFSFLFGAGEVIRIFFQW